MPRGKHLVREYRGVFRPIGRFDGPIAPPPKPEDSERSARPPAYWGKRSPKKKAD
jgi:hypothetical protein